MRLMGINLPFKFQTFKNHFIRRRQSVLRNRRNKSNIGVNQKDSTKSVTT